jgi:hypothetical protein
MFAYVLCCYFGPRRAMCRQYALDPYYFLKVHLNYLANNLIPSLDVVVIVVNDVVPSSSEKVRELLNATPLNCQTELLFRENKDGSYGAWETGLRLLLSKYPDTDYALLIEDDYIPFDGDIMKDVVKFMGEDVGYVCQYWDDGREFRVGPVAAISNGMIDMKKLVKVMGKTGKIFQLTGGNQYINLVHNQVHFLNPIRSMYRIYGMNNDYIHPFYSVTHGIIVYGHGTKVILQPIGGCHD